MLPRNPPRPIIRVAEVVVHQNPWWTVYFDDVEFPGGATGSHLRLEATSNKPGVVVLAVRGRDDQEILMVRQWRYAQNASMWELPRGFGEESDSTPAEAAVRELLEETGLTASSFQVLGSMAADSSILAGKVVVVLVTISADTPHAETDGETDASAWVPLQEVAEMITSGELQDGFTLSALAMGYSSGALIPR